MTSALDWHEIVLRLALSAIAGGLIGFDRSERGRPAGLRTTLLVCLASSIAMIETNLLLNTTGKAPNSFVNIDPLRLPLGILSGIGFIGAGTILRRDDVVVGVTTAATIWYVTVMGMCFGAGYVMLGLAALGLGLGTLWCLKFVERGMHENRKATLTLLVGPGDGLLQEIRSGLGASHFRIASETVTYSTAEQRREVTFELEGRRPSDASTVPEFLRQLAERSAVAELKWKETYRP